MLRLVQDRLNTIDPDSRIEKTMYPSNQVVFHAPKSSRHYYTTDHLDALTWSYRYDELVDVIGFLPLGICCFLGCMLGS